MHEVEGDIDIVLYDWCDVLYLSHFGVPRIHMSPRSSKEQGQV
jgi:hypothetical protein